MEHRRCRAQKIIFCFTTTLFSIPVERNGVMGFGVWIAGILSSQLNAYALPLNAWVTPDQMCDMTAAVIKIWRDNGERDKRPKGPLPFVSR